MKKSYATVFAIALTATALAENSGRNRGLHRNRGQKAAPTVSGVVINSAQVGRGGAVPTVSGVTAVSTRTAKNGWAVPTTSGVFVNTTTAAGQAGGAVPTVSGVIIK